MKGMRPNMPMAGTEKEERKHLSNIPIIMTAAGTLTTRA